jgi:muconolactone delta-isomerase
VAPGIPTTEFLVVFRRSPGAALEAIEALERKEAEAAWFLHKEGLVSEMYRRSDQAGGVMVFALESLVDVHAAIATLPLVSAGLVSYELISLSPFFTLESLFAKGVGSAASRGEWPSQRARGQGVSSKSSR